VQPRRGRRCCIEPDRKYGLLQRCTLRLAEVTAEEREEVALAIYELIVHAQTTGDTLQEDQ
jgi:hypothetical protein